MQIKKKASGKNKKPDAFILDVPVDPIKLWFGEPVKRIGEYEYKEQKSYQNGHSYYLFNYTRGKTFLYPLYHYYSGT